MSIFLPIATSYHGIGSYIGFQPMWLPLNSLPVCNDSIGAKVFSGLFHSISVKACCYLRDLKLTACVYHQSQPSLRLMLRCYPWLILHGHLVLTVLLYTHFTSAVPLSCHSSTKGASILKTSSGTLTEREISVYCLAHRSIRVCCLVSTLLMHWLCFTFSPSIVLGLFQMAIKF